jgi:3-deoxy-D-manno-octulosonic-acid transferase
MTHKVYNLCISFLAFVLPIIGVFSKKIREFIRVRRGIFKFLSPKIGTQNKYVWFHFASLGEFNQASYFISKFKQKHPQYSIVISFFSSSGYNAIKNNSIADVVTYFPIDSTTNAEKFIKIINPEIAIFTKYEFWLNHLHELNKRNIPIILISAIINENLGFVSKIYSKLVRENLQYFSKIFTQDQASIETLSKWNFSNTFLSGDTRVDSVLQNITIAKEYSWVEKFKCENEIWIAGSTWEPDEKLISEVFKQLKGVRLILAPHDVEESNIQRILKLFPESKRHSDIQSLNSEKIIIIDKIGELANLYRFSDFAHIGGGFGAGIHNTLEPAVFGNPITFGPKYKKFPEAVSFKEMDCAFEINSQSELLEIINTKLRVDSYKDQTKLTLSNYFNQHKGASDKILKEIEEIFPNS